MGLDCWMLDQQDIMDKLESIMDYLYHDFVVVG